MFVSRSGLEPLCAEFLHSPLNDKRSLLFRDLSRHRYRRSQVVLTGTLTGSSFRRGKPGTSFALIDDGEGCIAGEDVLGKGQSVFSRLKWSASLVVIELLALSLTATAQTHLQAYYFERGLDRYHKGDLRGAMADLDRFIQSRLAGRRSIDNTEPRSLKDFVFKYKRLVIVVPPIAVAYCARALVRQGLSDFDGAISDYDLALTRSPSFVQAGIDRGVAYHFQGRLDEAIADYSAALLLSPDNWAARFNRGRALSDQARWNESIDDLDIAISLNSKDDRQYYIRANAWMALSDAKKAMEDYYRAIRMNPKRAALFNSRGNAQLRLMNFEGAYADYSRAIELDPKCAEAYANRGLVEMLQGDEETAEKDFAAARMLDPERTQEFDEHMRKVREVVSGNR